jgi:hypothetical protein
MASSAGVRGVDATIKSTLNLQVPSMKSKRPFGITILALLLMGISVVFVVSFGFIYSTLPTANPSGIAEAVGIKQPGYGVVQDALLLFILFFTGAFISGAGLLRLQEWSRWLLIIQATMWASLILIINATRALTGVQVLNVVVSVLIVVYLNQSHVRQAFAEAALKSAYLPTAASESESAENDEAETEETVVQDFDDSTAEFVPPEALGLTRRNNVL